MGSILCDTGAYDTALELLTRGHGALPSGAAAVERAKELFWPSIVHAAREAGEPQSVLALLRRDTSDHPDNPVLLFALGECSMEAGEYTGAIDSLRKAAEARPGMNRIHFNLGKCLYNLGEDEAALLALERDLKTGDDRRSHFHTWFFKAMILHRAGRAQEARRALDQAKGFEELFGKAEIAEELDFLAELEGTEG